MSATPLAVVQAQLDAYNARDIEALLRAYAPDAEQFTLHGELLAKGHEQLRSRYLTRFAEPDLHARLLSRIVVGNIVTDAELVTRNFPEGLGTLEMLCVYEVVDGLIQKASFALGAKALHAAASWESGGATVRTSELVAISTFRSTADAQIAKGILDEAGIESMIRADNAGGMYPAISGAELLVRSQDVDTAHDALHRRHRGA